VLVKVKAASISQGKVQITQGRYAARSLKSSPAKRVGRVIGVENASVNIAQDPGRPRGPDDVTVVGEPLARCSRRAEVGSRLRELR
jgi:hypothetical protein